MGPPSAFFDVKIAKKISRLRYPRYLVGRGCRMLSPSALRSSAISASEGRSIRSRPGCRRGPSSGFRVQEDPQVSAGTRPSSWNSPAAAC